MDGEDLKFGLLIGGGTLAVLVILTWFFLALDRGAAPFAEETRRKVYQESVTGQTACQANLARIYGQWTNATPEHRGAFEAMARTEAQRYRCKNLDPAIASWLQTITY